MAYMNQEKKNVIVARVKKVLAELKKEGVNIRATYGVRNYSTFVMNISQANIDLLECKEQYLRINEYRLSEHYSPKVANIYARIFAAINADNHNNSDIQTDYFDIGYYVDVNVGRYGRPFKLVA